MTEIHRIYPIDYSADEIKSHIRDTAAKLQNDFLSEGERQKLEREMFVSQNHLVTISNIQSNETLTTILTRFVNADKKAAGQTKVIILLTLFTLVITAGLEAYHIIEENHNQRSLIDISAKINQQMSGEKDSLITYLKLINKPNTHTSNGIQKHSKDGKTINQRQLH